MKSDLIDLTLQIHVMSDRAIRVSDDGDDKKAVWLPLSQCEVLPGPGSIAVVTLPEWLATEKGLV
jgi:hypothetical protein